MRVSTANIGYRELDILSDLMHEVAKTSVSRWGGDVAVAFSYDLKMDCAICICENGVKITSDDI